MAYATECMFTYTVEMMNMTHDVPRNPLIQIKQKFKLGQNLLYGWIAFVQGA